MYSVPSGTIHNYHVHDENVERAQIPPRVCEIYQDHPVWVSNGLPYPSLPYLGISIEHPNRMVKVLRIPLTLHVL